MRRVLPALAVALVVMLFYGRALLPGRVLIPTDILTESWPPWQQPNQPVNVHNPLLSDVVNYIYPVKTFTAEAVRRGEWPLWNPYVFTGYPATYNTQAGLLYPLSLFYYVLDGATAADLTIFAQLTLGAWFMFAYLRQIKLSRPSALLGTLIFLFNGSMVVWVEWQVVHSAVIWLPAQLWAIEKMAEGQETRDNPKLPIANYQLPITPYHLLLALLFALPWFGGHWNWTLYSSMTVAIYMLFRLPRWGNVGHTAVALGLGTALTLIQVLPAFNYLRQTHRLPLPFGQLLAEYGLHSRAVAWFVPHFFGTAVTQNWWGPATSNEIETAVYVGLLPLALVLAALLLRQDWHTRFFALWGGMGLLWALGTPAYGLLYYLLPPFQGLHPSRAAILPIVATAVLAPLGLEALLKAERPWPRRLWWGWAGLAGFSLLLVAGWLLYFRPQVTHHWDFLRGELLHWGVFTLLTGLCLGGLGTRDWGLGTGNRWPFNAPRPPSLVPILLAFLLLTADLYLTYGNYNTIGHVDQLYPPTATTNYLQADLESELSRIVTTSREIAFFPNTALAVGIPNLSGYEPGVLLRMLNYLNTAEGEPLPIVRVLSPIHGASSPLLKAANVKHYVTTEEQWAAEAIPGLAQQETGQWLALPHRHLMAMPDGGLQRLDVAVRGAGEGELVGRILATNGLYEFANARIPLPQGEAWVSFYFSPFPSEWGREFVWEVSLETEGSGTAELSASATAEPTFVAYYLPRPALVHEAGKTRIYLNEGYLPRAFAVPQAQVVADESAVLAALVANQERLDQLVFLELEGEPPPPDLGTAEGGEWTAEVDITQYSLNEVRLTATLPRAGFVVLSDTFYAGWQARVNGERVPLYRANSIMRGVALPAGTHEVVFTFRPLDFYSGAWVSGLALATSLVGLVVLRLKASKRNQP